VVARLISPQSSRALVTGAGRGIGAAIAVALAEVGHPVILNYRSDDASAQATKARIEAAGGSAELCRFDVSDALASAQAIAKLLADERPIGVLVNNAGIARDNAFPAMSRDDWSAVTRTSLDGFFNVTQPLVMPMVHQRWGRIISIASISGTLGNRGQTNYAAAKAGLIGATKSLSFELAKRNITVNAVAPGLIETDMLAKAPVDELKKVIPMRRLGKPEEVAALVRFLASDDAAYITGQVITISGGLG
jgi:3-oxoacyl-[acyl-carrier protein] reductase